MKNPILSRRKFLRATGTLLGALFFLPLQRKSSQSDSIQFFDLPDSAETLGRVTANSIGLYSKPSENAGYLKTLPHNTVLEITDYVIGESLTYPYNKIWYELDRQGFAHSGWIQPVKNKINLVEPEIPSHGLLAEVSVPFTNGVLSPNWPDSIVYKLYFGSTYWINRIVTDSKGTRWYRILDEEGYLFYANATHLRIITPEEIAPISPDLAPDQKTINVNLKEQTVIAFENNSPVYMTRAATGAVFNTGNFSTPQGQFTTHRKRPSRHMMDPAGSSYDLPGVPWVCYVNDNGVAFHGTYWHNNFGAPRSHGCINLSNEAAKWIYRWTQPSVPVSRNYLKTAEGTRVDIW